MKLHHPPPVRNSGVNRWKLKKQNKNKQKRRETAKKTGKERKKNKRGLEFYYQLDC